MKLNAYMTTLLVACLAMSAITAFARRDADRAALEASRTYLATSNKIFDAIRALTLDDDNTCSEQKP